MPGPPTPGLTVPLTVSGPVVPVPPSVPPLATVTLLAGWLPLTRSVPALTVVGPVYVLVPDSVSTPPRSSSARPVLLDRARDGRRARDVGGERESRSRTPRLVDTVRVEPASALMVLSAENRLIPPVSVLLPLTLSTAPVALAAPVPPSS